MLTVIVTITGRYICSANSYCDNNGVLYVVLTVIRTLTGMSICSFNSYCENNGDVYMEC
jgi:heme O synthase-like polyprenyltransferase